MTDQRCDVLQGVGAAIDQLIAAGIHVWVLTGDKMETAINIAFACSLLTNAQRRIVISSESPAILQAEADGKDTEEFIKAEARASQFHSLLEILLGNPEMQQP